ncbi:universal stress protein A [Terasakiella brassicae]|uniref:Universal stress protein A n=1 Tax=Terasakiella brassicae TaxID=1634917 RepID=A0A917BX43_9PROT|nr:universal stress protein [Terasakiella brassicae]GGF59977.1 universal stress protein A [Terasakiella brassicae]
MSLKDILVHVDHSPSCKERIKAALKLAQLHNAHLTALYVMTKPMIPGFIEAQLSKEVIKAQVAASENAAKEIQTMFASITDGNNVPTEWRCVEGDMVEQVMLHARYADLTVLGQKDSKTIEDPGASEMPDQILLRSGRPVLIIPHSGSFETVGKHIMVAWDGSRLATRAVNDAICLMEKADKVDVLAVDPKNSHHGDIPGADISLHLARHDINAEAEHLASSNLSAGDALLSYAADSGIDLIVMGGYGHRRWREVVLGGVTRHMLKHMTVPVFMTH